MRERKEATIIDLLDEFQLKTVGYPGHRELVLQVKQAALQFHRTRVPGMLGSNYDWSENGLIGTARQIQSEYWSLVYYSLFIQITDYLCCTAWLHRSSLLSVGTEVTVELVEGNSFGQLMPCEGAFYAKVHDHESPNVASEQV